MLAAQVFQRSGDVGKVKLHEINKPMPSLGNVVVKILAAAGNGLDFKVMAGDFSYQNWRIDYPFTLGYEFAGVIDSISSSEVNTSFSVGDKVCGVNWGNSSHDNHEISPGGAFAEYILFPLSRLCHIPQGVSMKEAAAIGIVGLTAYQLLFECAKITSNSKILILGGSSSVGSMAIQLAKLTGAWVATTCNSRAIKYVNQFGPDQVINYHEFDWDNHDDLKSLDAVIDTVGEQDAFHRSLQNNVLTLGGVFVSIASFDAGVVPSSCSSLTFASFYLFKYDHSQLNHLLNLLSAGKIVIFLDRQFPFSDEGVKSLILYQQRGRSLGKNLLLFDLLATYHGSCSCGGVSLEVTGPPQASLICHCLPCQRLLSGLFAAFYLYHRINVTRGQDLVTSSGSPLTLNRVHFFCRVCGTCLYLKHPKTDLLAVLMLTLQDIPFHPCAHVNYSSRRQSFVDNLPKYEEWIDLRRASGPVSQSGVEDEEEDEEEESGGIRL